VYGKGDKTVVGIIKPTATMGMIDNQHLREIASEVESKLQRVFESI